MTDFKLGQHSTLQEESDPWLFDTDLDSEKLQYDMIQCMLENRGIGLAANQIGMNKRVFVMGSEYVAGFPKPFALFNPRIIEQSENHILDKEGCLSFPGLYLNIKRPDWVVVEYEDYKGNLKTYKAMDYAGKCVQHEIDHLNGICFVDIVSPLKLQLAKQRQRKNHDRT
jgi:peptide deformylase